MKKHEEQLAAIQEMRNMMDQATRFKSISGISGMLAGILAIVCVAIVCYLANTNPVQTGALETILDSANEGMVLIAFGILFILAVSIGIVLALRNARARGTSASDNAAKRLMFHLAIPVLVGGIFSVLLFRMGYPLLVAPVTLLFYGMGLLQASKFTLDAVRTVGLIQLALGLLATAFLAYGLLIWTLGFGLVHILYGFIIYVKYERA
jgi:hypothetical protein